MPTIPEIWRSIAGSLTRWALSSVFGYLLAQGALTPSQIDYLVAGIGGLACTLIWSLIQKLRANRRFQVALGLHAGASEDEVKREMRLSL